MKQMLLVFFCVLSFKTFFAQQKNTKTNAYEYYIEIKGLQNKQQTKDFIASMISKSNVVGFVGFSMPSSNFLLSTKDPINLEKFKFWITDRSLQIKTFQPGVFSEEFILNKKKQGFSNKSDRKQS